MKRWTTPGRTDRARVHGERPARLEPDAGDLPAAARVGHAAREIRRFAALVRQGPGNEAERLEILRRHEGRVRARMAALAEVLEVISGKVGTYTDHVARGTAAGVWAP